MRTTNNNELNASIQDEQNVPYHGLQILARMIAHKIISKRAIALEKENVNPTPKSN